MPILVVAPATHGRQMKDQQLAAQHNAAKLELQVKVKVKGELNLIGKRILNVAHDAAENRESAPEV